MQIKIIENGEATNCTFSEKVITPLEIFNRKKISTDYILAAVKIDNVTASLNTKISGDCTLKFLDINHRDGMLVYKNSLAFVLIRAATELFQDVKIEVKYALADGYYIEIYSRFLLTKSDAEKLKRRIHSHIEADEKFEPVEVDKSEFKKIFEKYPAKLALADEFQTDKVTIFKYGDLYNYFTDPLVPSAGMLQIFDLKYHPPGIILRFPQVNSPDKIGKFQEQPNLFKIFTEYTRWGNILNLSHVSSLNGAIDKFNINEIILTSEKLHENKIYHIARTIYLRKETTRVILISGPSSSGKTTFSKRLAIQLRVQGISSMKLSLDNYFVDREDTPRDEDGEYDFESIDALDKKLINKQINQLLEGEEVEIPQFNFVKGRREKDGLMAKLPLDHVLIIEGIHGLNSDLTRSITSSAKFKIYVSALTQLNLDNHNRISTSDTRIIRRIVRDSFFRGYSAEETLNRWDSINRGEMKYVFSFQEKSDIMFNSALVYELGVLKKYAIPELQKVPVKSTQYSAAQRLIKLLKFFKDIPENAIPGTSIIREFISGSTFEY